MITDDEIVFIVGNFLVSATIRREGKKPIHVFLVAGIQIEGLDIGAMIFGAREPMLGNGWRVIAAADIENPDRLIAESAAEGLQPWRTTQGRQENGAHADAALRRVHASASHTAPAPSATPPIRPNSANSKRLGKTRSRSSGMVGASITRKAKSG